MLTCSIKTAMEGLDDCSLQADLATTVNIIPLGGILAVAEMMPTSQTY